MRILNRDKNEVFDSIEIFLTQEEAEELRARISGLIDNPSAHHIHLDTDEKDGVFERELIIAIYSEDNLMEFDKRSRILIQKGI